MRTGYIYVGIAIVAAICGIIYAYQKKKKEVKKPINIQSETIDGSLSLQDVVGYFKKFNLNQEKDTPFIAQTKALGKFGIRPEEKEGYIVTVLGVFDKQANEILHPFIIYSKEVDAKISDLLKDSNGLVVLS
jgi:hypothetical protein